MRRLIRIIGLISAVVLTMAVLLLGLGLYTGALQERLAHTVLTNLTGGYVGLTQPVDFIGDKHVGGLVLGKTPTTPPVLMVQDLRVSGDGPIGWPPQTISAKRIAVQLTRDAYGFGNYDYLLRSSTDDTTTTTELPIIPEIKVDSLDLFVDQAGSTFQLAGLTLDAALQSAEDFRFNIHGDAARGRWNLVAGSSLQGQTQGPAHITLTAGEDGYHLQGKADLPDFAQVDLDAHVHPVPTGWQASLTLGASHLYTAAWEQIPQRFFATPVTLDALHLAEGTAEVAWLADGLEVDTLAFAGDATGLRIGPPDAPLYEGDVQVSAEGSLLPNESITATLTTDQDRALRLWAYPQDDQLRVTVDTDALPRGIWQNLVPPAYRAPLNIAPNIGDLTVTGELTRSGGGMTMSGTLLPALNATGQNPELDIALDQQADALKFDLQWREGNQNVLDANLETGSQGWTLDARLDAPDLPALWRELQGPDALPGMTVGARGPVKMSAPPDQNPALNLDLALAVRAFPGLSLPEAVSGTLSGSGVIDSEAAALTGGTFNFALEELGAADLKDTRIAGPEDWRTRAAGDIALDVAGRWFELPSLWGSVTFAGTLQTSDGITVQGPLDLSFPELGYGDFVTPYGETLTIKGDARLNLDNFHIAATPLETALAGTTLRSASGTLADGVLALEASTLESNLHLLSAMGFVDDATGTLSGTLSSLVLDANGVRMGGELALAADTMSVGEGLALLEGLAFEGVFDGSADTLQGNGPVRIDTITTGGAILTASTANLTLAGADATLTEFQTSVFNGAVNGTVEVDLFEQGLPINVTSNVQAVDLAIFTEQMQPPNVKLTGKVNGRAAFSLRDGNLVDLDIDLTGGEGLTLNRSLVEQILQTQDFSQMTGGKSVEKIIRQVLGEAPQRPFDKAHLVLGMEDGRIAGIAELNSEGLNLTVDITADPEAILAALRDMQ